MTRFISEFNVILRPSKDAPPIEERATAHDVTLKGFKLETQEQIPEKKLIWFTIELNEGQTASGQGRVLSTARETFASWSNVEITSMSWGEKRKLKLMLYPDAVDWPRMLDLCVKLLISMTVVVAAHRIYKSAIMRGVFIQILPKAIALMVMGWALMGMMRKDPNKRP